MKIKKNGKIIELSQKDLKRIVENSSVSVDEGLISSIKGIGGMFKGTGFNYTKYAYEMTSQLKELNEDLEGAVRDLQRILDRSKSKISFRQFESDTEVDDKDKKRKEIKPERPKLDSRKDPILDLLTKPLRALDVDTSNIKTVSKTDEVQPYKWVDWVKKNTVSKNESIRENIKQIKRLL